MIQGNFHNHTLQSSHELTPRDDIKKSVSEVLKRVDQLIRKCDLDRAQGEVMKAKEMDPRNVYALALEERISIVRKELASIQTLKSAQETVVNQVNDNPILPIQPKPIVQTQNPIITQEPIRQQQQSTKQINLNQKDKVIDRSIELESYRKALYDSWIDGKLSDEEKKLLSDLRTVLEITEDEHAGIEKNVKRECYRNFISQQISKNPALLTDTKAFATLRTAFQISEEEHNQIQKQISDTLQKKQRNKVLVIDDDTRLLELLSSTLEDNGFEVTALPTSDEAYALLRKFSPDLILCDINLETSTMGGFSFYEKVQELKNAQSIPFVFLTGLTDEVLIRTGKELGVDDYLVKPISEQTLVSTIRGKMKRYKQLKKFSEHQMQ